MYDTIRKGGIDGADYEQFKQKFQEYQAGQNRFLTATNRNISKSSNQSESAKSTNGSNKTLSTHQTNKTSGVESSNKSGSAQNSRTEGAVSTQLHRSQPTNESKANRTGGNGNSVDIGEPQGNLSNRSSVQLNSGFDPGLDKFFKEDITPAFKTLGAAGKEAYDVVNPPKASKAAMQTANTVRKARAAIDNYQAVIGNKYGNFRKFFNKYSDEQNIKNISSYERTGQFAVEPKTKPGEVPYSQLYHDSMVESYKVLRSAYGKDTEGFIENYVRRAFVFDNEAEEKKGTAVLTNFMRSLSASKSPLKQRVLDMPLDEAFRDMKDRDIKVKMRSTNPEELRQWSLVNAKKALEYAHAWKDLKQSKLIQFVAKGAKIPDGMIKLDDRAAQVFAPAEVHYATGTDANGKLVYSEKGYEQFIQNGSYYADPQVARILNNVISKGWEGSKLFQAARVMENSMNQLNLGLSEFHLTGTAINAGISDIALGMRNVLQGKPVQGAVKIARGTVPGASFVRDVYKGQQFIKQLMQDDPAANAVLEKLVNPSGARLMRDKRYNNDMISKMHNAFVNGNMLGGAIRIPHALIDAISHPLMSYAIPRVKIAAFLDLAENVSNRLPVDATEEQRRTALSNAWNSIDNRFGQLVYDNLFWNKAGKDVSLLVTRSVGWNLGTIRELGGGLGPDVIKATILGKGRVNTKFHERITDRTLYAAALISGVAMLGALYQYLHTGQGPQQLKDYFFPKNGGVDKNGNPTRTSLPTYVKDLYAYSQDPIGTILHKSSPLLDVATTLVQSASDPTKGLDYYGNMIRNPNDPVGTQLAQVGSYLLGAIMPFSVQQLGQQVQGKASTEQMIESFFGFVKAPAGVMQSEQQKAAQKAYQQQVGFSAPKTPEQDHAQQLKNKAYDEIRQNGWRNSPAFKELMSNGTLKTQRQRLDFINNAYKTPQQRLVQHLPKASRQQYLQQ